MKKGIFTAFVLSLLLGSSAMAASRKVCFGSTKDDDTKGVVLKVEITKNEIKIKTVKGDLDYKDTYPTFNSSVRGRDGKTYLEYEGESTDYQVVILVDQMLLNNNTTGLLQFRARGEGFFNEVFVCKDDAQRL